MPPETVASLAQKIAASPKHYILLLGSGISKDAGIKSGWEVTNILIRQVLSSHDSIEDVNSLEETELRDKYFEIFNELPTFSGLFDKLNLSSDINDKERRSRLQPIFENIEAQPTNAHKIIAQLAKSGQIGFIITTNFDDLLETALREAGITPHLITFNSNPKEYSVLPDERRIFKINGSYPDELKITQTDLKEYGEAVTTYLKKIFSEYGVITCGWSGNSDTALLQTLLDPTVERRYPVYWTHRGIPDEGFPSAVSDAGSSGKLYYVRIENADDFFTELSEKIEDYVSIFRPLPLTIDDAISQIEGALSTFKPDIKLKKLLDRELNEILKILNADDEMSGEFNQSEYHARRIRELSEKSQPLSAMLATLVYFEGNKYSKYLRDVLEALLTSVDFNQKMQVKNYSTKQSEIFGGHDLPDIMIYRRFYPALIALYSVGILAVKQRNYDVLWMLLHEIELSPYNLINRRSQKQPVTGWLCPSNIMTYGLRSFSRSYDNHGDMYLYNMERYADFVNSCYQVSENYFSNLDAYTQYFDTFEVLFAFMAIYNKHDGCSVNIEMFDDNPIFTSNRKTTSLSGLTVSYNTDIYREEIPLILVPFKDYIFKTLPNYIELPGNVSRAEEELIRYFTPPTT
ncbi:MAG: SIR2 family protein [Candidatus Cloacimonetes bacterium]|nr:SIR2 family protein [Candidatus Cloacimonadota bacterium]